MDIINEKKIKSLLNAKASLSEIDIILKKAEKKKGLSLKDCSKLLSIKSDKALKKLFKCANKIKNEIYGKRIVLFAPLYCSNYCINDCEYCAFHIGNQEKRKKLTLAEVKKQTEILQEMGHKRILLELGEDPKNNTIEYVVDVINTIYKTKKGKGEIRRVNVNIASTTVENYKLLKAANIGTYQLFQETFHKPTYEKLHKGPKADYFRQINAMEKAFEAGIDDLGIGVLFGLYDYRFEVLALIQYAKYMEKKLGVGPHTISVPRFQEASTVALSLKYLVSDKDFLKLIAIIRLAVPYTGMIISTRESPEIRKKAFEIGISQASAASSPVPGGYKKKNKNKISGQFTIHDHRSLDEVVQDICRMGHIPSFCTGCYRNKRVGDAFMKLAKTGNIQNICQPNAILTFKEYLIDYASKKTREIGNKAIAENIEKINNKNTKNKTIESLKKIEQGKRDIYI